MRIITVPGMGELLGAMNVNESFNQHRETQWKNWADATVATDDHPVKTGGQR
jgi:hypothetical protein